MPTTVSRIKGRTVVYEGRQARVKNGWLSIEAGRPVLRTAECLLRGDVRVLRVENRELSGAKWVLSRAE